MVAHFFCNVDELFPLCLFDLTVEPDYFYIRNSFHEIFFPRVSLSVCLEQPLVYGMIIYSLLLGSSVASSFLLCCPCGQRI